MDVCKLLRRGRIERMSRSDDWENVSSLVKYSVSHIEDIMEVFDSTEALLLIVVMILK